MGAGSRQYCRFTQFPWVITPLKEIGWSPRVKENLTSVGFEPTTSGLDLSIFLTHGASLARVARWSSAIICFVPPLPRVNFSVTSRKKSRSILSFTWRESAKLCLSVVFGKLARLTQKLRSVHLFQSQKFPFSQRWQGSSMDNVNLGMFLPLQYCTTQQLSWKKMFKHSITNTCFLCLIWM